MVNPVAKRLFGILVFALILTAFGGFSFAQEEPAEPQGIPEEEIDVPIAVGEISVTAQKREENIQDVPVAVSTITAEDLESSRQQAPMFGRFPAAYRVWSWNLRLAALFPASISAVSATPTSTSTRRSRFPWWSTKWSSKTRLSKACRCLTSTASRFCADLRERSSAATPRPVSSSSTRVKPSQDFDAFCACVVRHLLHHRHPGGSRWLARRQVLGTGLRPLPVARSTG